MTVGFREFCLVVALLCCIIVTLAVMHIAWQVP
jgi:hypothetical protein